MTKSDAITSLEKIKKLLRAIEAHNADTPLSDTDIQHRAHRERRNIDDIVSLIEKLDRAVK